jgi:transcriptional regulator with XRE-family HTH domain
MDEMKSPRHDAVRRFLKRQRQDAELSQVELAARMGRRQQWVSDIEKGQHRVSVVEFLEWSDALGFDAQAAIRHLQSVRPK